MAGSPNGTCGLCVLAPSGESLKLTGNGTLNVSKANIVVNSASKPAVGLTGNGSILSSSVGVVGTATATGQGTIQNLTTGIAPIADPLAGLTVPSLSVPSPVPSVNVVGNASSTISPGVYREISVTGNGSLTLSAGTYVILQRFTSTGDAKLTGHGVTIYLACSSYPTPCNGGQQGASLSLTGNGALNLTAPGEKCSPVAIFSDRNNAASINLTGNGSQTLNGVVYAASGALTLTGNGSTFSIGGPIVVGGASLTGNGSVTITGALPLTEGLALSLAGSPASGRLGETETLSATLTCQGAPMSGRSVSFAVTGANPGTATATTNSAGVAVFSYKGNALGTDTAQASFASAGASVSSSAVTVKWSKAQPTIVGKASGSVVLGQSVTDTATVSGGDSPTGTVTWNVYAASDSSCHTPINTQPLTAPLSGGSAISPAFAPSAPGTYQFIATYGGDANNQSAATKCPNTAEQVTVIATIGPISTQPQSKTVTEGQSALFTAASGATPEASAQWQLSTDGGKTWSNDTSDAASTSSESGTTTSTLTVAAATHSQNGYEYRAVFTNGAGAATSTGATLQVTPAMGACTDTYTGANNGLWQTASNWSTGNVPTSSDVACVGAGTTVDVTGGANQVGVLKDAGGLNISGGSLEVAGLPIGEASSVSSFAFSGGTLSLVGEFDVVSSLVTSGSAATISGPGSFVVKPGAVGAVNQGTCSRLTVSGATFSNQGTVTVGSAGGAPDGAIWLENGAQLVNAGTFNVDSYDSGCGYGSGGSSIYNGGGAESSITNTGTFHSDLGSAVGSTVNVPFNNDGTATAASGNFVFMAGGSGSNGVFSPATGATLSFAGGSFSLTEPTWSGPGTIGVYGSAAVTATHLQAAGANVGMSNGSLSIPAGSTTSVSSFALSGGTLGVAGEFDVVSSLVTSGSAATISGPGSFVVKPGAVGAVNQGTCSRLTVSGAIFQNQGTVTVGSAGGAPDGAIWLENGAQLVNAGTFNVDSYDSGCGFGSGGSSIYNGGGAESSITNTGTFNSDLGSSVGSTVNVPFNNDGTATTGSGNFVFMAGGSGTKGVFSPAASAQLSFAGGSFSLTESTWSGAGTVGVYGSAAVNTTHLQASGANVAMSAGSLWIPAGSTTSASSFVFSGGMLGVAGEFDVVSSLVTSGNSATISGPGSFVVKPGAVGLVDQGTCSRLIVSGATFFNQGTVTVGSAGGAPDGAIWLENGAQLVNAGTFNVDSYDSGCGYGSGGSSIYNGGGVESSITNTGTFHSDLGSSVGSTVNVPFNNNGVTVASSGTLNLTDGATAEQIATGDWRAETGGVIQLGGGTFTIEEGGVFQARIEGAHVIFVSSGLKGTLSPPPYAANTVTIAGHGEDSSLTSTFASATIEITPLGQGKWKPLCGPLIPEPLGAFSCPWNTTSGSYPDGYYELRAKLSDSRTPAKNVYTNTGVVRVANTPLKLTPTSAGPDEIGSTQTLTATLSDSSGAPMPGQTVALGIAGANSQTLSAVTNSRGEATFSYTGEHEGQDTAEAAYAGPGGLMTTSNTSMVAWSSLIAEVSSTPVQGNFFNANTSVNGFSAKPGDTPVFSQTFPTIDFNPPTSSCCADSSLNGYDLTASGSVGTGQNGPLTGSLASVFDGQTGTLTSTSASAGNTTGASGLTIEAWIKPTTTGGPESIAYKTYLYELDVYQGTLRMLVGNGSEWNGAGTFFAGGTIAPNVWQHVAGAYDASTGAWALYINGTQVASGVGHPGLVGSNPAKLNVGSDPDAGSAGYFFNGEISDDALYPQALSAAQIAADAKSSTQASYDGNVLPRHPIAYYKLGGEPLKSNPWFVNSTTKPFTDLTTDQIGNVDGAVIAQGNGLQAGVGKLQSFEAEFTADFAVAKAGDVTFKLVSEDGYLLGIGGGATQVSGDYENAPASNESVFQGLPLVGAYDKACCMTPQTHTVTVHFPAAGSYPYELDYFQHGGQQMSLGLSVASFKPDTSPLSVYVGYADGLRPSGSVFPFPWQGSPGVTFIGSGATQYDSGALRFDNSSEAPITLEDVSVDIGAAHFDLWGSGITVAPHAITILTQTEGNNFDSSDVPAIVCTPDGLIPQVNVTVEGKTTTYPDTGQLLNTGGVDPGGCAPARNESQSWTPIGGGGTPINVPLPPAVFLQVTPTTITGDQVGQSQKLTVTARDDSGKPVQGLAVNLHVYGANAKEIGVTTNSAGTAEASYTGAHAGQDTVSATASISGFQTASNQLIVPWAVPAPPQPELPPAPPTQETTGGGGTPPFVENLKPDGNSIVTGPTRVTATIDEGSGITGWKTTLTPAGGSPITLGHGMSTPPETLGTIDPSQLGQGTYQLSVVAETSGGSAAESDRITVGTTPGLPAPPPVSTSSGAPTLSELTPANGAVIGVATAVSAKASAPSGQSISGWTVTLEPHGGGTPTVLAETNQAQPVPIATIDPAQFASGSYVLSVTARASGGGYATASETVTLGAGVVASAGSGAGEPREEGSGTKEETKEEEKRKEEEKHKEEERIEGGGASTAAPPEIGAISPADGTIVTTPVPLKTSIHAPAGESISSWTVVAQGSHEPDARTLGSGTGTPPETLATFDPSKLPNDTYTVTVLATTSGGAEQSQSESLVVSGNLKLGRFLQTYKDLEIPVSGFDMRLERVYDSTDKSVGDFGVGWHVLLSGFTVTTNGALGHRGWSSYPSNCTFSICGYGYESSPAHTVTVTWPDKHQEEFVFAPKGQLLNDIEVEPSFTAKPGTNTTSTLQVDGGSEIINGFDGDLYNSDGNPWTATRFDLTTRQGQKFVLDTATGLVSEEDRSGNKLTVTQNGIESSSGPGLAFTRDSGGRITEVTGPNAQHLHYGYDPAGDLTSYTDADGNTTTYTYDSNHDLLDTTGPGASKPLQKLVYDAEGRLSEVIGADGSVEHISTNVGARTETIADPNGKLTEVATYDERGDLLEEAKAYEGKTLTTKHTYDPLGHLQSTTDPLGNTTTNTWAGNDLVAHTDANGNATGYEYDPFGELIGVIGPDHSKQLSITRNAEGQPTRIEHADGSSYTYAYDANGNPTSITEPSGVTEKVTYDSNAHPATITDGAGAATQFRYSASGQLMAEITPLGVETHYGYDGNGDLTSITDGNENTSTFTYDPYGHQLTATDPLGKTEASTYDEAGRLIKRVDRNGEVAIYSYDTDGRLVQESFADGEESNTVYNALEQPASLRNQTQALTFAYDADGRVVSARTSATGSVSSTTLNYTYDAVGNRESMSGPDGATEYGYDSSSRLTSLGSSTESGGRNFEFVYTPSGQILSLKRPNGVDDLFAYKGEELLARVASLGANPVAGSSYAYGPVGLRASDTESTGNSTRYTYDPIGQLTEATPAGGKSIQYEYDSAGNRAGGSYDKAEELISDGTADYVYDADGQLLKRTIRATGAKTTYDWNARHELIAVHLPNGSTEAFAYDPLGRRVSVTTGLKTTSYVYDGSNVHLEYDGPESSPTAVYTDGPAANQVLEMARNGHRYSYLVDGRGSTVALADESGNVVQRYSYDAFGAPSTTASLINPFLYTGQQWDPESGLYYYHARYYDPSLGRFISRDPVLHPNPYPYVENDPTNAVDPTGAQDILEQSIALSGSNTLDADSVTMTLQSGERAIAESEAPSLNQLKEEASQALGETRAETRGAGEVSSELEQFVDGLNSSKGPQGPFSTVQRGIAALVAVPALIYELYTKVDTGLSEEFGR